MRFVQVNNPREAPAVIQRVLTGGASVVALSDAEYAAIDTADFDEILTDLGAGGGDGDEDDTGSAGELLRTLTQSSSGFLGSDFTGTAVSVRDEGGTLYVRSAEHVFVFDDDGSGSVRSAYLDFDNAAPSFPEILVPEADDTDDITILVWYEWETGTVDYVVSDPGEGAQAPAETISLGEVTVPANATEASDMLVSDEGVAFPYVESPTRFPSEVVQGNGTIVVENLHPETVANASDKAMLWDSPYTKTDGRGGNAGAVRMTGVHYDFLATTAGQAGEDIVLNNLDEIMFGHAIVDGDPIQPVYAQSFDGVLRWLVGANSGDSVGTTKTLTEGDVIVLGSVRWVAD